MAKHPAFDRLQAIADQLGVPVSAFTEAAKAEADQDPSLNDLYRAFIAAAEAYSEAVRRKAQSVSLAGAA